MLSYTTLKATQSNAKKSFYVSTISKLCLCFVFIVSLITLTQESSPATHQRQLAEKLFYKQQWQAATPLLNAHEPGMVDVKHKRCAHAGCSSLNPVFNLEGSKRGRFCKEHAEPGMINVEDLTCVFASKKARNSFWKAPAVALGAIATGVGCLFPNGIALWAGVKVAQMATNKTWIRYTFRISKSEEDILVKLECLKVCEELSKKGIWTRKFKVKKGQTNHMYARLRMIGEPDRLCRNKDEMKHRVKLVFNGTSNRFFSAKVCDRWIYYNIPPVADTDQVADKNSFQKVLKKIILNKKKHPKLKTILNMPLVVEGEDEDTFVTKKKNVFSRYFKKAGQTFKNFWCGRLTSENVKTKKDVQTNKYSNNVKAYHASYGFMKFAEMVDMVNKQSE